MDDISSEQRSLEELGLSPVEAEIYLALLTAGSLGASAMAESSGRPRSSIYAGLRSLADRGLVEGGAGYGSRYRAAPPGKALTALLDHERELLSRRQQMVDRIQPTLEQIATPEQEEEEVIEVLRSKQSIAERFDRLQLEAEEEIDVVVKAPAIATRSGNPAEVQALERGVRNRGLYEEQVLEIPEVRPHLAEWQAAGEEIRIYPGELPLKMAIFDRRNVLVPLIPTGGRDVTTTLLIRHPSLGLALHVLFEHLWSQAKVFSPDEAPLETAAAR